MYGYDRSIRFKGLVVDKEVLSEGWTGANVIGNFYYSTNLTRIFFTRIRYCYTFEQLSIFSKKAICIRIKIKDPQFSCGSFMYHSNGSESHRVTINIQLYNLRLA